MRLWVLEVSCMSAGLAKRSEIQVVGGVAQNGDLQGAIDARNCDYQLDHDAIDLARFIFRSGSHTCLVTGLA